MRGLADQLDVSIIPVRDALRVLEAEGLGVDIRILTMSERAIERYVRIGFALLDSDPSERDRRREAHRLLVDEFRKRDPEAAARALNKHLAHNEELARTAPSGSVTRWPR